MIKNENITLYYDDALNVLPTIETKSINHCLTSPPYNRKRNDKYKEFTDINENYLNFNISIINEMLRICNKYVFYNIQTNYYNRKDVYKLIGHFSEKIIDIHIWEKTNPMPASGKSVTNSIEYFIILGDIPLKSNKTYTKNIVSTSVNSKMPKDHKAVMKPEVAEHFILNYTNENETIIDCFFGYGTTGIVGLKHNRKIIGIEKVHKYFIESAKNCNI